MNALMLLALLAKYNTKQFWEVPPLLEQYLIALNNKRLYGTSILLISFKHLIIYRTVNMQAGENNKDAYCSQRGFEMKWKLLEVLLAFASILFHQVIQNLIKRLDYCTGLYPSTWRWPASR